MRLADRACPPRRFGSRIKPVMHLPELVLLARGLGRMRRRHSVLVHLDQRKVMKDKSHLVAILGFDLFQIRKQQTTRRTLVVTILFKNDGRTDFHIWLIRSGVTAVGGCCDCRACECCGRAGAELAPTNAPRDVSRAARTFRLRERRIAVMPPTRTTAMMMKGRLFFMLLLRMHRHSRHFFSVAAFRRSQHAQRLGPFNRRN